MACGPSRQVRTATNNFVVDPGACAAGGSKVTTGLPVKDAGFLSCNQYNRADTVWRHPKGCTWFDDPKKPTDEPAVVPLGLGLGLGSTAQPDACRCRSKTEHYCRSKSEQLVSGF